MTIPTLSNCPHTGDGWCLDCVANLADGLPRFAGGEPWTPKSKAYYPHPPQTTYEDEEVSIETVTSTYDVEDGQVMALFECSPSVCGLCDYGHVALAIDRCHKHHGNKKGLCDEG